MTARRNVSRSGRLLLVGVAVGALALASPLAASAAVPDYELVATLPGADYAVATNDATNTAYTASYSDGTLNIIDGATNVVTATVPVGPLPYALAVNPTTNVVYTANRGDNTVGRYDGTTGAAAGAPIPVAGAPFALGVNPVTNRIYAASPDDGTVSIIDGATGLVVSTLAVDGPQSIAIDSVRNLVYVSGFGTIQVIDGATGLLLPPVTAADANFPTYLAFNDVTNTLYATNITTPSSISVIDVATDTLTATIPVGDGQLQGIAVNRTNNTVAIVGYFNNVVSLLDGETNEVTRITLDSINPNSSSINYVAVNQVTGNLYITEGSSGTVTVLAFVPAVPTPAEPAPTDATPAAAAPAAATSLAATGSDLGAPLGLGLALLLVGAAATLALSRKRRTV